MADDMSGDDINASGGAVTYSKLRLFGDEAKENFAEISKNFKKH